MHKFILCLTIVLITFMACRKERFPQSTDGIVRWGTVGDKRYSDSFPFINGEYRRYWVLWTADTTCPPFNPVCGIYYWKRVRFECFDTLFRNRYPERLADTSFIPDYPY